MMGSVFGAVIVTRPASRIPATLDSDPMHALYLQGGRERNMAPHVVYPDDSCPHADCDQRMHTIAFKLEEHGRATHDSLVTAWWKDTGFTGRCPGCGGWIHFSVRAKRAITPQDAARLPQLPDAWATRAVIL